MQMILAWSRAGWTAASTSRRQCKQTRSARGLGGKRGRGWPAGPFIYPTAGKTRPDHAKQTHTRGESATYDSIDISDLTEFGIRRIQRKVV